MNDKNNSQQLPKSGSTNEKENSNDSNAIQEGRVNKNNEKTELVNEPDSGDLNDDD